MTDFMFQFLPRGFRGSDDASLTIQLQRHRIPPSVVDYLVDRLTPQLKHQTQRNQALTPREQVFSKHKLGKSFYKYFAIINTTELLIKILPTKIAKPTEASAENLALDS